MVTSATGTNNPLYKVDPIDLRKAVSADEVPNLSNSEQAFLAYYGKAIKTPARKALESLFHSKESTTHSLETFAPLEHLNEADRQRVFRNCGAIQLSYGCNGACAQCGVDAVIGAQEHIPFPVLQEIFTDYADALRGNPDLFLYFASDPLDYRWKDGSQVDSTGRDYDYVDVHHLVQEHLGENPYISTVLPEGSDDVFQRMIREGIRINRLSVMPGRKLPEQTLQLLHLGSTEVSNQDAARQSIAFVYNVKVRNANVATTSIPNDSTSDGASDTGIGCFYGSLLTPRGVYNIIQLPGQHRSAPQKQLVIPYEGESKVLPNVGDDVRDVLRQHVVLHSPWHLINSDWGQLFFLIENPHSNDPLVVQHIGTTVTNVDMLSKIIDPSSMQAAATRERNTNFFIQCRELLLKCLSLYLEEDENWALSQAMKSVLKDRTKMNTGNFLQRYGTNRSAPDLIGLPQQTFEGWLSAWNPQQSSPANKRNAYEIFTSLTSLSKLAGHTIDIDPYRFIRKELEEDKDAA